MKLASTLTILATLLCLMASPALAFDDVTSSGSDDHDAGSSSVEDHGDHHVGVGDPPVEPEVFEPADWRTDLSIYSFIVFLVLLAVLTRYAWGPIVKALDEREERIRKDLEDAEQARVRSEEVLAEHTAKLEGVQDEVREILAEARRDAEHTKSEILSNAQQEAEATRKRATDEIDRARDQALDEIFGTLSSQVTQATEHVIGRALSDEDRNRLIDESLSQMSKA